MEYLRRPRLPQKIEDLKREIIYHPEFRIKLTIHNQNYIKFISPKFHYYSDEYKILRKTWKYLYQNGSNPFVVMDFNDCKLYQNILLYESFMSVVNNEIE